MCKRLSLRGVYFRFTLPFTSFYLINIFILDTIILFVWLKKKEIRFIKINLRYSGLLAYTLGPINIINDSGVHTQDCSYHILTAHNWQNWKRIFLLCYCYEIYKVDAVGLNIPIILKNYDFCEYVKFRLISLKNPIFCKTLIN